MMGQQTELAGQDPTPDLDTGAGQQMIRRATQLCLRSEPHTAQSPCSAHLSEANRQLFAPIV